MTGSGVVQTLSCDLSGLSWKKIIKKNILEFDAMKVIISQGGVFTISDIDFIVTECKENVPLLELVMTICTPQPSPEDLLRLCEQALRHKKFKLVLSLISCGAKINVARITQEMHKSDVLSIISYLKSTLKGRIELFFKAVKYSEYSLAESLLSDGENDSESVFSRISVSSCLLGCPLQGNSVDRQGYIAFVKGLLEKGVNPSRDRDSSPLDIVLKFPKEYQADKIELLTLLLQHGAAIEQCTHQRENETTLIHIAAKFVIDSGTPCDNYFYVVCITDFFWSKTQSYLEAVR